MADFEDDDPEFTDEPDGTPDGTNEPSEAEKDAIIARMLDQLPPNLHEVLHPLLTFIALANFMLVGHADDPVPQALNELLDYDGDTVKLLQKATDNAGVARLMAFHPVQLFDTVVIGRLVFESPLDLPLRTFLGRKSGGPESFVAPRQYVLDTGENLINNLMEHLANADEDNREELRMRRLQTESIFARLADTLRPFYPPGQSPEDERAAALDDADEEADAGPAVVNLTLDEGRRLVLATALQLTNVLGKLAETPFARGIPNVSYLRTKAVLRLAERLNNLGNDEPIGFAWSEVLRLYQASQVVALSTVADVLADGSLEDAMRHDFLNEDGTPKPDSPIHDAENARFVRKVMTDLLGGFVESVEITFPDNEEVVAAKAEITELAGLLE